MFSQLNFIWVMDGLIILLLLLLLLRTGGKQGVDRLDRLVRDEGERSRQQAQAAERALREELSGLIHQYNETIVRRVNENAGNQLAQLDSFAKQLRQLTQSNDQKLDRMRETVQAQLVALQEDNSKKLEAMRQTVDEKLHATLEKRLGESFQMVSERLEQVHKGLGEMQTLAAGVGDLKKVLTNVKTRGSWGEIQLGALLEQLLAPSQFESNVVTKPGCSGSGRCGWCGSIGQSVGNSHQSGSEGYPRQISFAAPHNGFRNPVSACGRSLCRGAEKDRSV